MIYTSYYANLKNIPENILPISISLFSPTGIKINSIKELAPNIDILNTYKNSKQTNLDRDIYIKSFKDQIKNFDFHSIPDNSVLLCYEHPFDFCHRQIVADLIEQKTGQIIQEYGFENLQKDYKNYRIKSPQKRVAVIGSRTFNNFAALEWVLNKQVDKDTIIVSGGAIGADHFAEVYAKKYGLKTDIYIPDWTLGKHAGFLRNKTIIDNCDEVIAFTNGSNGTANSIETAKKQNKKITIIGFQEDLKPNVSFEKKFSVKLCNDNLNKIYVFGDNLVGKGKGGQAVIRDCFNSYGIPTKRLPNMSADAFFSDKDDELNNVIHKLREIYSLAIKNNQEIVFPIDGLGTGLADMPNKSPRIFKEMNDIIERYFLGIKGVEIWN